MGKTFEFCGNIYWRKKATVILHGEHSEETLIRRGVLQGCVFSPNLFKLYSKNILREIEDMKGINLGRHNISNVELILYKF
jgi:hypothetical protein